ncbi:MAG TPA: hypothetical protein PL124_05440 [Candidatus Cloacimonadota bacterium]|nr:hypothetical protein [Candidatus Cloacimonadota bacterium]HPS38840.1 hypothetical protein [Candidatus Cloacimonadota bacterium]
MKITKETALKLYSKSEDWFKTDLEKAFGRETFLAIDYTNLKTFDDCCRICGTTEKDFEKKWADIPVDFQTIAFERLKIINQAINGEWVPDHFNINQYKWAPWFTVSSSGLAFSFSYYYFALTASFGFRLCFKSEEKSDHAGRNFTRYFQEFITGKKA